MLVTHLNAHPSTRTDLVRALRAAVSWLADGTLRFTFALEADLARVRIPETRAACAVDGLWRHTCFEAFLAREGEAEYRELNFSPSREWAGYAFRAYRERIAAAEPFAPPRITVRRVDETLELEAVASVAGLWIDPTKHPLRVGLCAVIEAVDGRLSYWALDHAAEVPDFHHRGAFALCLEPPLEQC